MTTDFDAQYEKLNKKQKEAVEALEGPVMVVAGPGTGKTQVLALRIANILKKTDIKADGILALTFTNSAVDAMRERLVRYIGEAGTEVNIKTFHSFGMDVIGQHFRELGLTEAPKLMEESDLAIFFDRLLHEYDWEHLRPRGDSARYFSDLKSLISLLKRERIGAEEFESAVMGDIERIKNDEENISSRGQRKGELKKEAENEIERLTRTLEVAKFFKVYEDEKKKKNVFDYDDVLENLVRLSEDSDDVASEIREKYLYVLIDEHQDSSRVQNEFLIKVWGGVERPDIFVVGDDRQLIYGFSGASIDHFQGFRKTFTGAKLITLLDNYRSTQVILDASHALLESVMSPEKLQ
ncbi:MAG: UvrD-helicase domain-containing protein, partial [Candidatus Curtissbacteria bacterium]